MSTLKNFMGGYLGRRAMSKHMAASIAIVSKAPTTKMCGSAGERSTCSQAVVVSANRTGASRTPDRNDVSLKDSDLSGADRNCNEADGRQCFKFDETGLSFAAVTSLRTAPAPQLSAATIAMAALRRKIGTFCKSIAGLLALFSLLGVAYAGPNDHPFNTWTYTAPANVFNMTFTVKGGGGGGGAGSGSNTGSTGWGGTANGGFGNAGGPGAAITATVLVRPGDVITGIDASGGAGGIGGDMNFMGGKYLCTHTIQGPFLGRMVGDGGAVWVTAEMGRMTSAPHLRPMILVAAAAAALITAT